MALALEDVRQQLRAVRGSARLAEGSSRGLGERAKWVALVVFLGLAIYVASRLADPAPAPAQVPEAADDAVLRRLAAAPLDDEGMDPEEEADVTRSRGEASIPWEEAKRGLAKTDRQLA